MISVFAGSELHDSVFMHMNFGCPRSRFWDLGSQKSSFRIPKSENPAWAPACSTLLRSRRFQILYNVLWRYYTTRRGLERRRLASLMRSWSCRQSAPDTVPDFSPEVPDAVFRPQAASRP